MKNNRAECKPTIVNREILMSEDNDFMSKERIDSDCDIECSKRKTCKAICDLLQNGKHDLALNQLENETNQNR